jgi:hypothetical protein
MRNKYEGYCLICKKHVPPNSGHFERHNSKWYVRCKCCVGKKRNAKESKS